MSVDASNIATAVESTRSQVATRSQVTGAIRQAAGSTGTSFEYLLATAKMESNLNPSATASTSSAKGLFQFIEQTWLGTVKEAGSQFGYSTYADAISKSESGSYSVSDPKARAAIMKLRDDPAASSAMAGVLTQSNSFKLTGMIGRRPNDSELYMAHFMGVNGAAKLITNADTNPTASGAALFPNAAEANRSIFYDGNGGARSVSQVYSVLSTRYASAANAPATRTALASAGVTPATGAVDVASAAAPADNATYLSGFPDLRTANVASFASDAPSTPVQNEPMFRSLFRAGDRAQPVSPAVQELWGNNSSLTSANGLPLAANGLPLAANGLPLAANGTLPGTPVIGTPKPLDLFSDRAGTFSG